MRGNRGGNRPDNAINARLAIGALYGLFAILLMLGIGRATAMPPLVLAVALTLVTLAVLVGLWLAGWFLRNRT